MTSPDPNAFASTDDARAAGGMDHARVLTLDAPLDLEAGGRLERVDVCYETYGTLNAAADNAVLICHAVSGDSHVARHDAGDAPGWWDLLVGPGKFVDTDRFFVVCSNVLGGCRGTTGPGSIDPVTGRPYGADFPAVTLADLVQVQRRLLASLGVEMLHAVVGGSMGGHQALTWATRQGESVRNCVLLATGPRLTSQALAFDVVGRNAILRDPFYHGGQYYDKPDTPAVGLALARMLGHITYLSRDGMTAKFDPVRDKPRDVASHFEKLFGVGSYLAHQGDKFVERFDANSYVTLTRAMDGFDLGGDCDTLTQCFADKTSQNTRFGVVSFSSDWLFPPEQSRQMVEGLSRAGRRVSYLEITSDAGHDAFLLPDEADQYGPFVEAMLAPDARPRPVGPQLPARQPSNPKVAADQRAAAVSDPASVFHGDRLDYEVILDLIPPDASILDLGCGDGELLTRLRDRGHAHVVGIDVTTANVLSAVRRGLDVIDADLNKPLRYFGDEQFDVVVLSQTLQSIENTVGVLREVLRVGRRAVVSLPNFAFGPLRRMLFEQGRSPKTDTAYAYEWYESPNRRYASILDFRDLCNRLGLTVEKAVYLETAAGRRVDEEDDPNLNADLAVMVLSSDEPRHDVA